MTQETTDFDGTALEAGAFYWALPVMDADYDEADAEWWNAVQPARYMGNERWAWLNTANIEWPARWVGDRLTPPIFG